MSTFNNEGIECPECHHVDRDDGEWLDGAEGCGEYECPKCEHVFMASRSFSIYFRSWNKEAKS